MSLTQIIAGSWWRPIELRHKPKPLKARAALLLQGHSVASFAREHGVSRQLVQKIIHGRRPARSGKSAAVLAAIQKAKG